MYAGQEPILRIDSASVERGDTPGALKLSAQGATASAGYTQAGFLPRVYAAQPPDGIYEFDVVAMKPAGPAAQVVTPIEVKGAWSRYTDGRVKGVKLIAKTNEVVAMLPPG
jgi:hypothetical protein